MTTLATEHAWGADALAVQLQPWLAGLTVEVVTHTASTNTDLMARARARPQTDATIDVRSSIESAAFSPRVVGGLSPCLRVAEHQTAGRGRQGRGWYSEPNASLTFSLGLCMARADLSGLSLAVGVALSEALQALPGAQTTPRLALKWPNDLWLMDAPPAGRKLGGVLVETLGLKPGQRWVVIGVGLNVLSQMTPELQRMDSGFAALQELRPQTTAPMVLAQVALPLVQAVRQFESGGFAPFVPRFESLDLLRGHTVTITQTDALEGVAQGVSECGELLLQTAVGVQRVSSGEVSVRLHRGTA